IPRLRVDAQQGRLVHGSYAPADENLTAFSPAKRQMSPEKSGGLAERRVPTTDPSTLPPRWRAGAQAVGRDGRSRGAPAQEPLAASAKKKKPALSGWEGQRRMSLGIWARAARRSRGREPLPRAARGRAARWPGHT